MIQTNWFSNNILYRTSITIDKTTSMNWLKPDYSIEKNYNFSAIQE